MNWIDPAIILFIIIFLIIGIKKGFMSSVLSKFSFGIIALIAFFLYKPLLNLLNNWFGLENAIYNSYYLKLTSSSSNFETNLISLSEAELQPFVKLTLNCGAISVIPKFMFSIFLNNKSLYSKLHSSNLESRTLGEIVSSTYASFFSSLISFIITFILICLLLLLFKFIINKLRSVGFIKAIDNFLGAFYGILNACLIIVSICFIIKLLSPLSFMQGVTNYISNSFMGKIFYNQITDFLDNALSYSDLIHTLFNT